MTKHDLHLLSSGCCSRLFTLETLHAYQNNIRETKMILTRKSKITQTIIIALILELVNPGHAIHSGQNCTAEPSAHKIHTFRNPITEEKSLDPYVFFHSDHRYYWTATDGLNIILKRSKHLTNLTGAKSGEVFNNQESSFLFNEQLCRGINIVAPEMHYIRDKWFIYFAMEVHNGTHIVEDHRNYVIEALTKDPFGSYGAPHKLCPEDVDTYATHGTVLQHPNGFLYFIWSGKSNFDSASIDLYMSKMDGPLSLSGHRLLLRKPTMDWEMMSGAGAILEAPQVFHNFGKIFLIFSASNSSDPDNCLGISSIEEWKHPLVAANWFHNTRFCVFGRNDDEGVYGVGKVSVTTSPDGKESWMIYRGTDEPGGSEFTMRAERFGWSLDGYPDFAAPAGIKLEHIVPTACIYSDEFKYLC